MSKFVNYLLLITLATLIGCAGKSKNTEQRVRGTTAKMLYEQGLSSMKSGNYRTAIQKLELLDNRYPFGNYTQPGQLNLIYAYFKSGNSAMALATAERFVRQNPQHPRVDYAYYMKGLVNYTQESNILSAALSADANKKESARARQAFEDFGELIKRYPNSQYVNDARQRMVHLRNRLAEYELHVARYYMTRDAFQAALNRAKYVVEHFPKTKVMPEALEIMMTSYKTLGLDDLAENTRQILVFNFPKYKY